MMNNTKLVHNEKITGNAQKMFSLNCPSYKTAKAYKRTFLSMKHEKWNKNDDETRCVVTILGNKATKKD